MKYLLAFLVLALPGIAAAAPLWSGDRGPVEVDQDLLGQILAGRESSFQLPVEGLALDVQVTEVSEPNLGVTSLRGHFTGRSESFFLLCRTDNGGTVAFFQPGDGQAYRLDHTSGRAALRQVEAEEFGPCGGGLTDGLPAPAGRSLPALPTVPAPAGGREAGVADDGSRQDILVGYTPNAEAVMGGWDLIRAEAQLAVDAANWSYVNSGIGSYLRLVHVMSTDYEEISAWSYDDHVIYLATPDDGRMDDMITMRNRVGADFVSVLIDGRDFQGEVPTCGVAFVMQSDEVNYDFEYKAYSVVSVQCAAGNWSLSHEVGHNRGCAHNRQDASIDGAYSYSYGLRFTGNDDVGYRTVMAYDHFMGGYERIPHFSNPDIDYAGTPTGVPPTFAGEAHNALTHQNTEAVCSTFRSERTFVQFGNSGYSDGSLLFPHPSIAQAIIDSRAGGHIVIENDDPTSSLVLSDRRVYVHDSPGSAVLGGN